MVHKCCCCRCYCLYIAFVWEVCGAPARPTCASASPTFFFFEDESFFSERDAKSLSLLLPLKHPVLWVWQLRRIDLHCNKVLTQVITRMSDGMESYPPSDTPERQSIQPQQRNFVVMSLKETFTSCKYSRSKALKLPSCAETERQSTHFIFTGELSRF